DYYCQVWDSAGDHWTGTADHWIF
nr:immunoglobulin light chain junction region [Macaca mulatta]MOX78088.1 immunoglobulin light chain junction region [Macaca mulatta]MOX78430.1 immunoglobulin light chain junction region [Macaca mulatta]MOX78678.1 immunoglobulin light chain junction region [Macaca mulatta]MOX78925.1 immunoglobulin light chain junction region [Macaca mulatta]